MSAEGSDAHQAGGAAGGSLGWLLGDVDASPGEQLRSLIDTPAGSPALVTPGAVDGLSALLARQAGARALYLSGAAFSASLGLPDIGLFGLEELTARTRVVVRASGLPVVVDADTGFGETLNVVRAVRELEDAGAAAVQIEDQVNPKRCGHLDGKEVVPAEVMVEKVAAASHAARSALVVARTDAVAVEGVAAAIDRSRRYVTAGADVIFPEALGSEEELAEVAAALAPTPLLANLTEFGKTPLLGADRVGHLGYRIAIFPVSALRVAARAMSELYADLVGTGTQLPRVERMQTRAELYELLRYEDYAELDTSLARGWTDGPTGRNEPR